MGCGSVGVWVSGGVCGGGCVGECGEVGEWGCGEVGIHGHAMACIWQSVDNLQEWFSPSTIGF